MRAELSSPFHEGDTDDSTGLRASTPNNTEGMNSRQGVVAIGGITPSAVARDSNAASGLARPTSVMEGASHT